MRKTLLVFIFSVGVIALRAQAVTSLIADYQHMIKSNEARIRADLKVTDPLFFETVDTVMGYCTDRRFTTTQQIQNLQGLQRFLGKVKDREQIRSGQTANLLLFYLSIMDWRKEGEFYENLRSYSSFAMKCASFFLEDSSGIKFINQIAEIDPDQILIGADQLADNRRYKPLIEAAILEDPDFAKRYFFGENAVTDYASESKRYEVRGIYELFEKYGTKTKAYILYDNVRRNIITPYQADSIALDYRAMMDQMIHILERQNLIGTKSVLRELDYRSIDWMRKSSAQTPTQVNTEFSKFNVNEKLSILVFGYRECSPEQLNQYLSLLQKSNLASVSPTLIENLGSTNVSAFLHFLDKEEKLTQLLSLFSEPSKDKLSSMLATDENENNQSASLESIAQIKTHSAELEEKQIGRPQAIAGSPDAMMVSPPLFNKKNNSLARSEVVPTSLSINPESYTDDMIVEPIHIPLSDSSRDVLSLKRNIFLALQDISSFVHKPYAKDFLLYAAAVEPDEVFKKVDMYKGKFWCKEVLEAATLNAPLSAKRYSNNLTHPVTVILSYSKDPVIRRFVELSKQAKFESKPFLLFDEMVSQCITLDDASLLCRDNYSLFKELMSIAAQKNYIGRYNVEREMNYYALRFIRSINDKVDESERQRFASVDNLSCDELYYMMVYGREEVFHETFEGLFSRFQSKCSTSGFWNAHRFVTLPHYRSFISMCAAYGKLDRFLSLFTVTDQRYMLRAFASSLDKERDQLSDAATVAETVTNTSNVAVLQVIQSTIKDCYLHLDSIHDYNGMAIYGILSALNKDKAVADKKWFSMMSKRYKVGSVATLSNAILLSQKVFVERMYFYDDEDGRDSYKNFITTFSASPDWRIDQYFSYVRVTSVTGKKVEIYANKAELEESGDKEISKIIKDNNYNIGGVIHRGHSFHTESTLSRVPASARFIFVGSCGGFYKINIALRKAPDAHIISTRQVGVKQINDPIFFGFNEYVRQGKDINWKLFWDDMNAKLGKNSLFSDYVPPHKNLESLFVRAYYQIMSNE